MYKDKTWEWCIIDRLIDFDMSVVYHVMMPFVVSSDRYRGKGGAGLNVSVPQQCDNYDYVQ